MRVMAVDDEQLALDYIENLLLRMDEISLIERTQETGTALQKLADQHFDVLFLDIEMPELNGLAMADQVALISPATAIVFVTAHRDYAIEAFELEAIDYLVKPIRFERMKKTIYRLMRTIDHETNGINTGLVISLKQKIKFQDQNDHAVELKWRTSKARELFLYLLHHFNKTVSKAEIVEIIWSEADAEKAFSQLYTVVYHVRKTLAPFRKHLQLVSHDEGYCLTMENVSVDIFEWKKIMFQAEQRIRQGKTEELEAYLESYQGDYLTYSSLLWPEEERINQQLIWREKAMALAEHFESDDRWERALRWYTKILHRHPLDEEVHFLIMKLLARLKRPDQVEQQYARLKKTLDEELGLKPDPLVTDWYETWRDGSGL